MAFNGSGDRAGKGFDSWMDKPAPASKVSYDLSKIRPAGMSDESDSDDYDYGGYGFSYGDQKRRKTFQWKPPEVKRTPTEELQNACTERDKDLGLATVKAVMADNKINLNDALFPGGWTLLLLACKHRALKIVEYLITETADVHCKGKDWYTPLLALANCDSSSEDQDDNDIEIAKLLLSKNASVNCCETHGLTPLMFAVKNRRLPLVRLFLDKGADVNQTSNTGLTALHFAAQVGNGPIVRLLLEKGANAALTDENDTTPLQTARNSQSDNCLKVIQLLDWVDSTKWRPGLHPDLIDEENAEKSDYYSTDVQQYCDDQAQQIELYLIVHDMEKYVPLFKKEMIQYNQFFWMNHKQLLEVGIEDEEDRNRVIEDHNKSRKKDQICPPFMRDGYTAYEALYMLTNIGEHVEYQTEILEGFYRLIKDNPESLNFGIDTYTPTDLIEGSLEVTETTYKLDKAVAELYTSLTDFEKDSKRKAALLNKGKGSMKKLTILGILTISVSVGIGIMYMRRRS